MTSFTAITDTLKQNFGASFSEFRGQTRAVVERSRLFESLEFLKDEGFTFLADVTCVDYLNYRGATDRFGLVYNVVRPEKFNRIIVRCMVNEPDLTVPSVVELWETANWLEREVWDMFGIEFENHPDHRRILMPEEFTAFPLRKDYPMQGRGERHNFPVIKRSDG